MIAKPCLHPFEASARTASNFWEFIPLFRFRTLALAAFLLGRVVRSSALAFHPAEKLPALRPCGRYAPNRCRDRGWGCRGQERHSHRFREIAVTFENEHKIPPSRTPPLPPNPVVRRFASKNPGSLGYGRLRSRGANRLPVSLGDKSRKKQY